MSNAIADTIYNQLGGNRFVVMTGARNHLIKENGLQFDLPKFAGLKINRVVIALNENDTYDIEFGRISRKKDKDFGIMMPHYETVKTVDDVYVDSLRDVFKSVTGLDTSL